MKELKILGICRTPDELRRGLQGRKEIPADSGMVFDYGRPGWLAFWMKDTIVPLQVAFVSVDRRIVQISRMKPLSLESIACPTPCDMAIEVLDGTFDRMGIVVGDEVSVDIALETITFTSADTVDESRLT